MAVPIARATTVSRHVAGAADINRWHQARVAELEHDHVEPYWHRALIRVAMRGVHPSMAAAGIGALAGLAGATGLLLYFRALAVGLMGVVAPLSAVVGAGLPLVLGIARVGVALAASGLISTTS